MPLPGWRELVFSLKTFAAAMLALFVAFSVDLPRPAWAMLTVFIVAQPFSGMVQSKAAYRVAGTLGGAAFAVFALPTFVNAPLLLSLVLALWLGACLYLSLIDRTPRAYAFKLAGYTAAIVGFPSVAAPGDIFTTALARSEEIILGILCVTLVDMLVLPRRVGPVLAGRIDAWLDAAARLSADILGSRAQAQGTQARSGWGELVADATALESLRVHANYDTPALRASQAWLDELQRRMRMLLSVLVSIEDRLAVLLRRRPERVERLRPLLAGLADRIGTPADDRAEELAALLARHRAEPPLAADWEGLVEATLLARLADLLALWQECRGLRRKIAAGARSPSRREPAALHRDHLLAGLSAVAAVVSTLTACGFWIASGWPEGGTAATMAAVLACLFAATDDPAAFALTFLACTAVAAVIGAVYIFAVLPLVDGFALLAAVLAVLFIPLGTLLPIPVYFPYVLPLMVNTAGFLGIQGSYSADFLAYANGAMAQLVGMGLAVAVLRLLRSVGVAWTVRRLAAANQDDLVRLAAGDPRLERERFEARVFDRVGSLLPRLREAAAPERRRLLDGALADLRVGLNLLTLHEDRRLLPPAAAGPLRDLLDELATFFRLRDPVERATPATLRPGLDAALAGLARTGAEAMPALLALTGIRRALFPDPDSAPPLASTARTPELAA